MKTTGLLIIFSVLIILTSCKVKIISTNMIQINSELENLEQNSPNTQILAEPSDPVQIVAQPIQIQPNNGLTYITILEGTHEVYAKCNIICHSDEKQNLYTEVTNFPGYGKIYRCQCDNKYSKWYNLANNSEVSLDILLGDSLFNHYLNLLGRQEDDCSCDPLKSLLEKMVQYS